jgi:hypothetical protein
VPQAAHAITKFAVLIWLHGMPHTQTHTGMQRHVYANVWILQHCGKHTRQCNTPAVADHGHCWQHNSLQVLLPEKAHRLDMPTIQSSKIPSSSCSLYEVKKHA